MSTPKLSNCPYSDVQRLEAAQWFLDISEVEDPSPEMLQSWLSWLGESEGNRLAFESIETVWHCVPAQLTAAVALTAPATDGLNDDDGYDTSISVEQWRQQRVAQNQVKRLRRWPSRQRTRRSMAAAAIVAVAIATSWFVAQHPWFRTQPASSDFATRTGEHMQITLADGSRVTLGARSRLTVGFTSAERAVWLQTGEAFFSVHKDSVRPFKVHALDGVITAVGTAFNVRATEAEVTVAVEEGVVNITDARHSAADRSDPAAAGPLSKVVNLRSGEQLAFVDRGHASGLESVKVSRIDPAQPARWREGWLVYRDEPLRYVIADVARYTDSQITGGDSIPDNLHFTGAVFKDSVVEWVKALPQVFPIDIQATALGFRVVTITPPITSAAR
jgi:transmembrane sensor